MNFSFQIFIGGVDAQLYIYLLIQNNQHIFQNFNALLRTLEDILLMKKIHDKICKLKW